LVAVFGEMEALQERLWLTAMRQGMQEAPQVVWLKCCTKNVVDPL
jgi:hypothetical protein